MQQLDLGWSEGGDGADTKWMEKAISAPAAASRGVEAKLGPGGTGEGQTNKQTKTGSRQNCVRTQTIWRSQEEAGRAVARQGGGTGTEGPRQPVISFGKIPKSIRNKGNKAQRQPEMFM